MVRARAGGREAAAMPPHAAAAISGEGRLEALRRRVRARIEGVGGPLGGPEPGARQVLELQEAPGVVAPG
eukprot:10188921-Lingulodinium_polyedra.AAC.1